MASTVVPIPGVTISRVIATRSNVFRQGKLYLDVQTHVIFL